MTDQLRDPEPFGERIDDGKLSREEAIAAGLLSEDGEPGVDERAEEVGLLRRLAAAEIEASGFGGVQLASGEPLDVPGAVAPDEPTPAGKLASGDVFPEPRQDAAVFGAPSAGGRVIQVNLSAPSIDPLAIAQEMAARARGFQAQADRDGYGR